MNLIEKYVDSAIEIEKINQEGLSIKNNLRRNNRLAKKLRNIAVTIESHNPELKNDFCGLLFHNNSNVRIWCAHHMLEVMTFESEQRRNALAEILAHSVECYGEKLWSEEWYTNNPQDKLLL